MLYALLNVLTSMDVMSYFKVMTSLFTSCHILDIIINFSASWRNCWPHDEIVDLMKNLFDLMTYFWCHDAPFDVMMSFWSHDVFLMSWQTFWRHDLFLMSWQTFSQHDIFLKLWRTLWRHDPFMTSWSIFRRYDALITSWRIRYVITNSLTSWCNFDIATNFLTYFWHYHVFLTSWRSFDVMMYFWRHEIFCCFCIVCWYCPCYIIEIDMIVHNHTTNKVLVHLTEKRDLVFYGSYSVKYGIFNISAWLKKLFRY